MHCPQALARISSGFSYVSCTCQGLEPNELCNVVSVQHGLGRQLFLRTQLRCALANWFEYTPSSMPKIYTRWRSKVIQTPSRPCIVFKKPDFRPTGCPAWLPVCLWPRSNPVPLLLLAVFGVVCGLWVSGGIDRMAILGCALAGAFVLCCDCIWWLRGSDQRRIEALMRNPSWSNYTFHEIHTKVAAVVSQLNSPDESMAWPLQIPTDDAELLVWTMAFLFSKKSYLSLDPRAFSICDYLDQLKAFQPDLLIASCCLRCILQLLKACCCCFQHIKQSITLTRSRQPPNTSASCMQSGDTTFVVNTSGTSGTSSIVRVTRSNIDAHFLCHEQLLGSHAGGVSLQQNFLPFGIFDVCLGGTVIVPPYQPPAAISRDYLREHFIKPANAYKVTVMGLSLCTWEGVADFTATCSDEGNSQATASFSAQPGVEPGVKPEDFRLGQPTLAPTVRVAVTGGAPVFVGLLKRLSCPRNGPRALAQGVGLASLYSMTEASYLAVTDGAVTASDLNSGKYQACAELGYGVPMGNELGDTNLHLIPLEHHDSSFPLAKLGISGHNVAKGYSVDESLPQPVHAPSTTADDMVFNSGDVAWKDQHGQLWHCGRQSDVLLLQSDSGTFESTVIYVPPVCVESVLHCSSIVRQCALVSITHDTCIIPVLVVRLADMCAVRLWSSGAAQLEIFSLVSQSIWASALQNVRLLQYHVNSAFPTDYRHNSKIQRHLIQQWATDNAAYMTRFHGEFDVHTQERSNPSATGGYYIIQGVTGSGKSYLVQGALEDNAVLVSQTVCFERAMTVSHYVSLFQTRLEASYLMEFIDRFSLPLDSKLCELSGGQRKVLALAVGLAVCARFGWQRTLVLDEVLAGMDSRTALQAIHELRRVRCLLPSLIIVAHDYIEELQHELQLSPVSIQNRVCTFANGLECSNEWHCATNPFIVHLDNVTTNPGHFPLHFSCRIWLDSPLWKQQMTFVGISTIICRVSFDEAPAGAYMMFLAVMFVVNLLFGTLAMQSNEFHHNRTERELGIISSPSLAICLPAVMLGTISVLFQCFFISLAFPTESNFIPFSFIAVVFAQSIIAMVAAVLAGVLASSPDQAILPFTPLMILSALNNGFLPPTTNQTPVGKVLGWFNLNYHGTCLVLISEDLQNDCDGTASHLVGFALSTAFTFSILIGIMIYRKIKHLPITGLR